MSAVVTIGFIDMQVIEHQGQRVVTLAQVDAVHGRPEGTARRTFNANRRRLLEGEDFFKMSADEFRTRFPGALSDRATEDVTLLFETGYLMLVKSLTDDLAWRVQRQLVTEYFRARTATPALPCTYADALRQLAAEVEAREAAEVQARTAIATKAEIGSRREATAMNTASQAMRRADRLEQELDRSKDYATVKRMEMLYHGTEFNWRLLKSTGIEMGIPSIDVFDANYGTVKAYHASVWQEAYAVSIKPAAA